MAEPFANSAKISPEEQGRRVKTGRILRGHDDRRAFGKTYGIPVNALRDYEQGKRGLSPRDRTILAEVLELPKEWFTQSLEEVLGGQDPGALRQIADTVAQNAAALERIEGKLGPPEPLQELEPDARDSAESGRAKQNQRVSEANEGEGSP